MRLFIKDISSFSNIIYNKSMKILYKIALLLVCLCLSLGGVANADMACCLDDGQSVEKVKSDEPCHEQEENSEQQANNCNNCNCQHCVSIGSVVEPSFSISVFSFAINAFENQAIYSNDPDGLYQPPKHIS
jgi:hypothetical protein